MADSMVVATVLSAAFAGVSAAVAAIAIVIQFRTQQSERYLDQATLTLKNAYEALVIGETLSDARLSWLTCARHIERYKAIKKYIKLSSHTLICDEQEEYWRHKFYMLLGGGRVVQPAFYLENRNAGKDPIEPKSAIIVHDFTNWPDGKVDPIDEANIEQILDRGEVFKGNIGLRHLLESIPKYRVFVQRYKI